MGAQRAGPPLQRARAAIILVHGRGSSGQEIPGLSRAFDAPADAALIAPNATRGTWYPQRFLAPLENNEPWLGSALEVVDELVREAQANGIPFERIGLVGFSQGACLILEYTMRQPRRFGFVAGLSGALIGPPGTPRPVVDLQQTPVLIACAEHDAHVPVRFVEQSAASFSGSGAVVTKQIFPCAAHTVFPEEIERIRPRARFDVP
ncbi:MAG: alpha/beta hydrolase [Opitutaceae bacterium]